MTVKIKVKDRLEENTLDLSCCDLEDVPVREIATVKKGTHLDLSNNQLVRLPNTFVTLTHLIKLDLSKNLLEELPENIGDLKQLKDLDLYSNRISRLPLSFGELKNLKWLDLKDNPLNEVLSVLAGPCGDKEQCQNCATNVITYYISVKETVEKKKEEAMIAAAAEERKREAKRRKNKKRKKNASKDSNNTNDEKEKVEPAKAEVVTTDSEEKDTLPEPNSKIQVTDDEAPKGGLCSKFCYIISSLLLGIVFLALIIVLVVIILPKFDEKRSEKLVQYLQTQTGLPVKVYQRLSTQKLDSLVEYAGFLMNHTRILVRDTYQRHFGEELVDADDADL